MDNPVGGRCCAPGWTESPGQQNRTHNRFAPSVDHATFDAEMNRSASPLQRLLPAAGFAAALLLLAGCGPRNEFAPPPPPGVTVITPSVGDTTVFNTYTGRIDSSDRVEIVARIPGFLEAIHFEDGASVEAGDLLFSIQREAYESALQSAEAALERAHASQSLAETRERQQKQLFEQGAISEIDYLTAVAELEVSSAGVSEAEAAVANARLNLSYTKIKAPMSGRISKAAVSIGNLVGSNAMEPLATIVQDDPFDVYFNIPERILIHYLRVYGGNNTSRSLPIRLTLADGSLFPETGTIDYAGNEVTAGTATIEVRARFPNPTHIVVPGMFSEVGIPSTIENAVRVPESLLLRDQAGTYVYTVNEQNQIEATYVTQLRVADGEAIVEGLAPDARVVSSGLQRVRPGITVTVQEATPPPDAPTETPES